MYEAMYGGGLQELPQHLHGGLGTTEERGMPWPISN